MNKSVFEYSHYKTYLRDRTGARGSKLGVKSALARTMGCQPTYLSQVLHDHAHLSLEQAEKVNEFFGHNKEESDFFLLLVQKERAGTPSLAAYFQEHLNEILRRRLILSKRLGEKVVLNEQNQSVYYSSWIYAAIHIALTIPKLRTREAIGTFLKLPLKKVSSALDFLCSVGLARAQGSSYSVGETQVRLSSGSYNLIRHHSNWRTQALEALDREELADLHYSGVISLSREDVIKVKNILLEAISQSQNVVRDSKEEELYAVALDFFTLRK
jgi:uncharacterized protein (TIGR02147 family)